MEGRKWPWLAGTCALVCVCPRERGSIQQHLDVAKMQKPGAMGTHRDRDGGEKAETEKNS